MAVCERWAAGCVDQCEHAAALATVFGCGYEHATVPKLTRSQHKLARQQLWFPSLSSFFIKNVVVTHCLIFESFHRRDSIVLRRRGRPHRTPPGSCRLRPSTQPQSGGKRSGPTGQEGDAQTQEYGAQPDQPFWPPWPSSVSPSFMVRPTPAHWPDSANGVHSGQQINHKQVHGHWQHECTPVTYGTYRYRQARWQRESAARRR